MRKLARSAPKTSSIRPISFARRVPIGLNGADVSSCRHLGADAARQDVGPVLGAVQAAHVLVVRVEDDVLAGHDVVGGDGERHAAGGGVALQRADDDMRLGLQDVSDDVVDRVEVVVGLLALVLRGLDDVEVDAVGEEVLAAHQHDDLGLRAGLGVAVGVTQTAALLGAHRAVVEVEVQVADLAPLLVGDLAERLTGGDRRVHGDRQLRRVEGHALELERAGRGQLEGVARLRVRDPDRAVDGRAADGAVAGGDDLAGAAAQAALEVRAEQEEVDALDRVEHARVALGGADLAHDAGGAVRAPVDRAVGLLHQRAQTAGDVRVVVVERRRRVALAPVVVHGLGDGLDGAATDLMAVEAALADLAGGELARGPDVAGVGLLVGLQEGDPPLVHAELDGPVQRGRTTVALRARVDHEAAVVVPDRLRDERLQERAHDQLGLVRRDRGLHLVALRDNLDLDVVALLGEGDENPLGQTVVGGDEEEDPQRVRRRHGALRHRQGRSDLYRA